MKDKPKILSIDDLKKRQVGYQEISKPQKIEVRGTVEAKLPDIPLEPLDKQEKFLDQQIAIENKKNVKARLEQTGNPLGMVDFITAHPKSTGVGIGSILLLVAKYLVGC